MEKKVEKNIVGIVRPFEDVVRAARTIYEHLCLRFNIYKYTVYETFMEDKHCGIRSLYCLCSVELFMLLQSLHIH